MATILAALWLVIAVFGVPLYRDGPLTAGECAARKAAALAAIDRRARTGKPFYLGDRRVARSDVTVECRSAR